MLSSDIVDSIIFLNKNSIPQDKMQRKALLPVLLACSLNVNTFTCMQYAASFVAVKMTIFK